MSGKNPVSDYIRRAQEAFSSIDTCSVIDIAGELASCVRAGGKILVCGNGGSAADASHLAGELIGRFRRERPPVPALALTVDSAVLTAVGNDYGFDRIYERQVEALGSPGDILIAISTSGNSPNVVKAAQKARGMGLKVIAFTSVLCEDPAWADIHWQASCRETSHAQELMLVSFHAICHGLEALLAEE